MTKRHTQRDNASGRFAPAVPDADTSVTDLSAAPQGEHDRPADATVYPAEFTRPDGSYSPLRGRNAIVIDANTGQALSDRITDVRGILTRPYGRTSHAAVQINGEVFQGAAPPEDTMRGYRRTPGTGKRLPSMYQRPDVED